MVENSVITFSEEAIRRVSTISGGRKPTMVEEVAAYLAQEKFVDIKRIEIVVSYKDAEHPNHYQSEATWGNLQEVDEAAA